MWGGVVMVQEVTPPPILHHPEVWSLPSDLFSESSQCDTVGLSSHSLAPGLKFHVNESITVKESCQHGGLAGAGMESFAQMAFISRDPLAGLDLGFWIKSWQG